MIVMSMSKFVRTMTQQGLFATMKGASKSAGNMTVKKENSYWRSGKFHLLRHVGKDI